MATRFADTRNADVGEYVQTPASETVKCRRSGRSYPVTFTRTLPDSSENYALTEFHWAWFVGSRRNKRNWPNPVLAEGGSPSMGKPKYPLAGDDSAFKLKKRPQYQLAPTEIESRKDFEINLAEG